VISLDILLDPQEPCSLCVQETPRRKGSPAVVRLAAPHQPAVDLCRGHLVQTLVRLVPCTPPTQQRHPRQPTCDD